MVRVHCDYNTFEFIFGVIMSGIRSSLITKNGLNNFTKYNNFVFNQKGYEHYYNGYSKIKDTKQIKTFLDNCYNFKSMIQSTHKSYIKNVYLTGKSDKFISKTDTGFNLIKSYNNTLQKNNPKEKRRICKSDVYLILDNNKTIGISVKMNKKCTKFNYSIEKILRDNFEINDVSKIKNNFLLDNRITRTNYKCNRDKYNKLFYDRDNIYWNVLSKHINDNSCKIASILMNNYNCTFNNLYPVYEIIDNDFYLLSKSNDTNTYHLEENEEKKEKTNASKLYYNLKKGNEIIMNLEIRWKGCPFVSPQFLST
jgi:hypothetical protein